MLQFFGLRYRRVSFLTATWLLIPSICGIEAGCQSIERQSPLSPEFQLRNPAYRMRPLQLKQEDGSWIAVRIWSKGDGGDPAAEVFVVAEAAQGLAKVPGKPGKQRVSNPWIEYLSMRWATAGLRVIEFDLPAHLTELQQPKLAGDILRRTSEDPGRGLLVVGAGAGVRAVSRLLADPQAGTQDRLRGLLLIDPPVFDTLSLPREVPFFAALGSGEDATVSEAAERAVAKFFDDESRAGGVLLCRNSLFGIDSVVSPFLALATQDFLLDPAGFDGDGAQRPDARKDCGFVQHPLR
jgi:hypothetical protein